MEIDPQPEPCPFCRGPARYLLDTGAIGVPRGLVVEHAEDCFLGLRMMGDWPDIVIRWNTRPQPPAQSGDVVERVAIALSLADPDERGLPAGKEMGEFYRELARAALSALANHPKNPAA